MIHQGTHPGLDVAGCFACRIAGISFSAVATPTRRAGTFDIMKRDQAFDQDSAAYRRLRKNGTQPNNIKGSALLEKGANSKEQVEGRARKKGG